MSCSAPLQRFIKVQILTAYYLLIGLLMIALGWLRDLSRSSTKRALTPPASLTDPKYGVHKYIKVNNIKLHYVESGDPSKPLMLFLHGFPEFWYSWRHQIVDFQKDYWCIAVDLRGYGDSERPEGTAAYDSKELLEDVRDLIRQLGRDKLVLVSHDWGGLIACKFRDTYPEMLISCIVMSSLSMEAWVKSLWSNPEQMRKSWYVFLFRVPAIPETLLQINDLAIFDQSMLVAGKNTVTKEDIECYKFWFGKTGGFTPPVNYYRANFAYCLPEKQVKGKVPMLVIYPSNDPYIEQSNLELMIAEYGAETAIIENSGHFLQQEEPEKVNKTIRQFLQKHNITN